MRQWAWAVVHSVRRQLRIWCEDHGRPDWYQVFSAMNFPEPGAKLTQQTLAEELKISRDQVRYALETAEKRFVELLREEVADQVGSSADVDAEIRELQSLLQGRGHGPGTPWATGQDEHERGS
jgi:hypothetical protein